MLFFNCSANSEMIAVVVVDIQESVGEYAIGKIACP